MGLSLSGSLFFKGALNDPVFLKVKNDRKSGQVYITFSDSKKSLSFIRLCNMC